MGTIRSLGESIIGIKKLSMNFADSPIFIAETRPICENNVEANRIEYRWRGIFIDNGTTTFRH